MGRTGTKTTKEHLAKRSSEKQIVIDQSIKLKKIEQPEPRKYYCSCCGKEYTTQNGNFPISHSMLYEGNNGYLTICRYCVEKYYQQMVGFFSGNEEHAIEHCCALFDWYYNTDVVAMTRNSTSGRSKISMYPSKMNMQHIKSKGTTFLDTIRDRHGNKILNKEDVPYGGEEDLLDELSEKVDENTIRFWGFGYSNEEYLYLDDQYQDWTTRYEAKTKSQEELFKSICVVQLGIQRAQKKGNTKEITDLMKTFQDLLGTANLKPNQSNDNVLAEQNTFGTLIQKWEEERPISEPDEEWKDVDHIKEYIGTYFFGHLCKTVDVKNDYEAAYTKEMEKYTVYPPVYEEDDLAETSLLDKFSEKRDSDGNT